jgi:hypothetical protein
MDYLTNYYKNKAELLEKKIYALQRNINLLMERAETPSLQVAEPTFDQAETPMPAPFKDALAGSTNIGTSNTTPQQYVRERDQIRDQIVQAFYEWYRNFLNTNGRHPTAQEIVDGYRQVQSQNLNFSAQYLAWVQQQIQRMNQQGLGGNIWGRQWLNPIPMFDWQQLEIFLEQNGYPGETGYPWRPGDSNNQNEQWLNDFYQRWRQIIS